MITVIMVTTTTTTTTTTPIPYVCVLTSKHLQDGAHRIHMITPNAAEEEQCHHYHDAHQR